MLFYNGCLSVYSFSDSIYFFFFTGKRREEAKQKKQELHKLELRNIELKVEMNWLEKEVAYLKSLMKLTKSF